MFRVGAIVSRTLRQHGLSAAEARARADTAMRSVLLPPELLHRYPAQLSGGQLQRVAIALALALRAGQVVEQGPAGVVIAAPRHDYTRELLAAVPRLSGEDETLIPGTPAQGLGE